MLGEPSTFTSGGVNLQAWLRRWWAAIRRGLRSSRSEPGLMKAVVPGCAARADAGARRRESVGPRLWRHVSCFSAFMHMLRWLPLLALVGFPLVHCGTTAPPPAALDGSVPDAAADVAADVTPVPDATIPGAAGPDGARPPPGPPTLSKVDVVFVVDNWRGMLEKQRLFSVSAGRFMERLITPRCVDAAGAGVVGTSVDGVCATGELEHSPVGECARRGHQLRPSAAWPRTCAPRTRCPLATTTRAGSSIAGPRERPGWLPRVLRGAPPAIADPGCPRARRRGAGLCRGRSGLRPRGTARIACTGS